MKGQVSGVLLGEHWQYESSNEWDRRFRISAGPRYFEKPFCALVNLYTALERGRDGPIDDKFERIGGLVYNKPRDRLVDASERRRRRFYTQLDAVLAVERSKKSIEAGRAEGKTSRPTAEFVREGGPIAWRYLTPRCNRMLARRELNYKQAKACALFVYFHRINWLMWSTGTNFPKGEKLSGGGGVTHRITPGVAFPIHKLDPKKLEILMAALVAEVAFKDLPHINGDNRLARHRSGRRFFLDAIDAFAALLTR